VFDVVHANAEFLDQVSDHDPILLTLAAIPAAVPEPDSWALMALGLLGLMRIRHQSHKQAGRL
jgi:uncharacterized protein